jgi:hypothetical protein
VVLEEDEDQIDLSLKNEDELPRAKDEQNIMHNMKRRNPNWIYKFWVETDSEHIIEGKIESTGRRGRRRKKQLDDLKDTKRYQYFKEEVLDPTIWRTGYGSGCGPFARQVTK